MNTFKIMQEIKKASKIVITDRIDTYWYHNHRGKEFDIKDENEESFTIIDTNPDRKYVFKEDAEVIEFK